MWLGKSSSPTKTFLRDNIDEDGSFYKPSHNDEVTMALQQEHHIFSIREKLYSAIRITFWLHLMMAVLAATTLIWYLSAWTVIMTSISFFFCPKYYRLTGYVGKLRMSPKGFIWIYGGLNIFSLAVCIILTALLFLLLLGRPGPLSTLSATQNLVLWSVVCMLLNTVLCLAGVVMVILIYRHNHVQLGDLVERALLSHKDIRALITLALSGSQGQKESAAFELASLAAASDVNKRMIVLYNGLPLLMGLVTRNNPVTQRHAIEALGELLVLNDIQVKFIDLGGARIFCSLLHSKSNSLAVEAAAAISFLISSSDLNKRAFVEENGLDDIYCLLQRGSNFALRILARIMMDLTTMKETSQIVAEHRKSGAVLLTLLQCDDKDVVLSAIQALQYCCSERPGLITENEGLLQTVFEICPQNGTDEMLVSVSRILLVVVEANTDLNTLLSLPTFTQTLGIMASADDAQLLLVVAKTCHVIATDARYRYHQSIGEIRHILRYILDHCTVQEVWYLADIALSLLGNDDLTSSSHTAAYI